MSNEFLRQRSLVYDKAYKFAIRVVNAYKYLTQDKKEFILSKQLVRSGTSMGANIAEANGAVSEADFSAKMSIAFLSIMRYSPHPPTPSPIGRGGDRVSIKMLTKFLDTTRKSKN